MNTMLAETCLELDQAASDVGLTAHTPAETWLEALQGADRARARQDLRALLLRGLCACLKDRFPELSAHHLDQIVERSLERIQDRLERFPGGRRFASWALKIAVHTALTFSQQS